MTTTTVGEPTLPLPLLRRGKVREVYEIDDERLLIVTSDRISAFDVIMNEPIPMKGAVLTQMSAYWFNQLANVAASHFINADTDEIISEIPSIADHRPALNGRSMLVRRTEPVLVECVIRGYITGSAWSEYQRHSTVSGKPMPSGMVEGDPFPEPIFTPTTKAEIGHDENMSDEEVVAMVGVDLARRLEDVSKAVFQFGHDFARERGVILADTKMEFGLLHGQLILIDELLTPDSSRFWDMEGYEPGKSQPSFDKQFVRDYLTEQGWDRNPPAPELPDDIVAKTADRYLEAYRLITGESL